MAQQKAQQLSLTGKSKGAETENQTVRLLAKAAQTDIGPTMSPDRWAAPAVGVTDLYSCGKLKSYTMLSYPFQIAHPDVGRRAVMNATCIGTCTS